MSKEQAELCLKPYSPLAVVLWFTLTQHEETSWPRLDGLKEKKKARGDGSKGLRKEREKQKEWLKLDFPTRISPHLGCVRAEVLAHLFYFHTIFHCIAHLTRHDAIFSSSPSLTQPNQVESFIELGKWRRRQQMMGDNAKNYPTIF